MTAQAFASCKRLRRVGGGRSSAVAQQRVVTAAGISSRVCCSDYSSQCWYCKYESRSVGGHPGARAAITLLPNPFDTPYVNDTFAYQL